MRNCAPQCCRDRLDGYGTGADDGQHGLRRLADEGRQDPQAVDDYMKGKESAAKFLVGHVMKVTRGKANPGIVGGLIVEQLEAMK